MAYLISHIALSLVFAQLLGLLLGWLLWGYVARQRGKEVQLLRERLADMQMLPPRSMAMAADPRMVLADVSSPVPGSFIDSELPERTTLRTKFFEDEEEEQAEPPSQTVSSPHSILNPPPIAPDLEAMVRDSRQDHLQQQVRELEGFRDRLPMLQADLSDAIAGRRAAEARFQEAKNDFEVRSTGLLSQIRDFENAAVEWDKIREQTDLDKFNHAKELAAVKATLRDLQNSQRPQNADAPPTVSEVELADLRERYQRTLRERDAIATELELLKEGRGGATQDAYKHAELAESLKSKDAQLTEQSARVESLLWRVAELEPFAAEAPLKEENLRRQESEIAGHMAMHSENAERIQSLQNHVAELQATTIPSDELQRILAEHQTDVQRLHSEHGQRLAEVQQSLAMKDDEITEHVSARSGQTDLLNSMRARITELEAATQRMNSLEKSLGERDAEFRSLLTAHGEMQSELETWKTHVSDLSAVAANVPTLQNQLAENLAEVQRLHGEHQQRVAEMQQSLAMKDDEITEHVSARSGQNDLVKSLHVRITELEAATQQMNSLEKSLGERDDEFRSLLSAHGETQRELETWKTHASDLSAVAANVPALQNQLAENLAEVQRLNDSSTNKDSQLAELRSRFTEHSAELQQLKDSLNDKDRQHSFLQERLDAVSSQLATHQQRLVQLEPLAARTPELEQTLANTEQQSRDNLKVLEERHQNELTRLKASTAQRVQRIRKSITGFKA